MKKYFISILVAEQITYRQYMADPSVSQVMVFGVVKESVLLANFMVRLKVVKGKITEIETIVARKDESSFASPEDLKEPRPVYYVKKHRCRVNDELSPDV